MEKFWQFAVLVSLLLTGCGTRGSTIGTLFDANVQKAILKTAQGHAKAVHGEYSKAEADYNEALALLASPNNVAVELLKARTTIYLANLYMEENRYKEAKSKFEEALNLLDRTHPAKANERYLQKTKAECLAHYAMLLRAMQQPGKAGQAEAQAKGLRSLAESSAPGR